jgi:hypothetical protein
LTHHLLLIRHQHCVTILAGRRGTDFLPHQKVQNAHNRQKFIAKALAI